MDVLQRPLFCLPRCMEHISPTCSFKKKAARAEREWRQAWRGTGGIEAGRHTLTPCKRQHWRQLPGCLLSVHHPWKTHHVSTLNRARAVSTVTAGAEPEITPLKWKNIPSSVFHSLLHTQSPHHRALWAREAQAGSKPEALPGLVDDVGCVPPVAWLWAGEHRCAFAPPESVCGAELGTLTSTPPLGSWESPLLLSSTAPELQGPIMSVSFLL